MNPLTRSLRFARRHEQAVYFGLCLGIAYSLVFWTLLNSILCILLAGYWLFLGSKKAANTSLRKTFVFVFMSLYLVVIAGLLNTSNMPEGLIALQQKSALLLFPLVFGTSHVLSPEKLRSVLLHFMIATTICCVAGLSWGLINFSISGNPQTITREQLILFPDIYPYIMGLFCLVSIITAFTEAPTSAPKRKVLLFGVIGLLSVFIILLSIRLVIACWLLTILFYAFKDYIKQLYQRLILIATLFIILILSVALIPTLQQQWKDLKDTSAVNTIQLDTDASLGQSWGGKAIRMAIWKCALGLARENWLLGVGSGDVQDNLQITYEKRQFYFASRYNRYNTHNQYLQSLIGNGLPGLLSLLWCIALPFTVYKKKRFSTPYYLFLLLFMAICFTESILETNKGIVWYSFINSIFAFNDFQEA